MAVLVVLIDNRWRSDRKVKFQGNFSCMDGQ